MCFVLCMDEINKLFLFLCKKNFYNNLYRLTYIMRDSKFICSFFNEDVFDTIVI